MSFPSQKDDPSSYANTDSIQVKHAHLDLKVDFTSKKLSGSVLLDCKCLQDTDLLVLDTSYLEINRISIKSNNLKYKVHQRQGALGSPLTITLDHIYPAQSQVSVQIDYSTTKDCTAIQWLAPTQTVGKQHPYLFTQCQAIHCRSLVPLQDTPTVKMTYSASICVPKPLRALMSAVPTGETCRDDCMIYQFKQATSIPSYLIALAVGNLQGKRIGPRSTVWTEPQVLKEAAWEFEDTESFIKTGEDLLIPYLWGQYDLLLLPASFPYGGMENPCLTFVTPSLLAGDRSLVDVVAHEIAHSWAGNLVTTSNWEHFWLNEGFTVYIERKIIGKLHGEQHRHFSAIIGYKSLLESIQHYQEIKQMQFTCLVPDLKGVDPDDAFSSVPYEKGFNLLFYLETLLGDKFELFLKAYMNKFSHQSIKTEDFKAFLYQYFDEQKDKLDSIDWDQWFKGQGLPPVENEFDKTLVEACQALADRWIQNKGSFSVDDLKDFSTLQKIAFLDMLLQNEPMTREQLDKMNQAYSFNANGNCEILFRWYSLGLASKYDKVYDKVCLFLGQIGRMKYVRPLYRALNKCDSALAKSTFLNLMDFYHPICTRVVKKDLGL